LAAIPHALMMSLDNGLRDLWALILGFEFSAVIQAVVSREEMGRLLPDAYERNYRYDKGDQSSP
jgi:hypothetical protein